MVHYEDDHEQVLGVVVVAEDFWVLLVDGAADRITLTNQIVDYDFLWDEKEGLLRRYVPISQQSDQLTMFPESHRVINRRILRTILFQPFVKVLIFVFILQPLRGLLINNRKRVSIMLLQLVCETAPCFLCLVVAIHVLVLEAEILFKYPQSIHKFEI